MVDFMLNMIWLPIGTSQTYGFRTAQEAFLTTYNGTGAPPVWNVCLSFLATAGILIGFDASGHVAEETKNAPVAAARGIFWSTITSGIGGFICVILFLFCVVSFDNTDGLRTHTVLSDLSVSLTNCSSLMPTLCSLLEELNHSFLFMPSYSAKEDTFS